MSNSVDIRIFWYWFETNVKQIADAYDHSDTNWLRENVSPQVKRLGASLNWEIGPYHEPDRTFVISPTIRENLELTRDIVASAPNVHGWRFLHARPAKELDSLVFDLNGHAINADGWQYQLTAYNGGEFVDVDLYLDAVIPSVEVFTELVVESLVGEERRLDDIGHISTHVCEHDSFPDDLTPIKYLKEHLDDVLA